MVRCLREVGLAVYASRMAQQSHWRMNTPEHIILQEIERLRTKLRTPIVVAVDGGSGAGKTTIAERLVHNLTFCAGLRPGRF
jgi:adenylylsulfate kinase-like enzyme